MFGVLKKLLSRSDAGSTMSPSAAAQTYYDHGKVCQQGGDLDGAIRDFRHAIELDPENRLAYRDWCLALVQKGDPAQARKVIQRGLSVAPLFPDFHYYLGNLHSLAGESEKAVACYRKALSLNPDYVEVLLNLGTILRDSGQFHAAEDCFRHAIKVGPDSAYAYINLGLVFFKQGQFDTAAECYRKAIACDPSDGAPYLNLGIMAFMEGRMEESLAWYGKTLEVAPGLTLAYYNRSMLRLLTGDLRHGLPDYEYRWGQLGAAPPRSFPQPLWLGETDLAGKTILLHGEQGMGDTLQFVRYVTLVAAQGTRVVLEVQPALRKLLDAFPGTSAVLSTGDPLPDFDCHCPLMSLPLAFKTELATIPAAPRYLTVAEERIQHWAARLESLGAPRIGIVWSGNAKHLNDHNRSVALADLLPVLGARPAVSLQKEVREQDLEALRATPTILDISAELLEFADTAAAIENLDLVITVDTSVAHLAGALGKPVWILLPFIPDWRWLLDRSDSPWYPSARLFRQSERGNWSAAFAALEAALLEWHP
ncbi:MAG: tetratricopeptide repeat protein [Rhodocyclaceae bacterium]|nr:tetratricopeptide repeat protein [Rhodocyclaceae bacterium]